MTSPRDKADAVRIAITSTSTCTPTTVALLNALLLPVSGEQSISKPLALKSGSKATVKGSPTATKNVKSKTKRAGQNGVAQLSPREKSVLATEVINTTLKVLGAQANAPAPARHRQPAQDLIRESARKALRRSNSLPQSPLQPRSLHRVSSTPSIGIGLSRSSSSASSIGSGIRAAAECARIAFSCLRILQSSNSCMSDLPQFQLENGMSALIGKLIVLGLDDLALKELRILKRRLEASPKTEKIQSKANIALVDSGTVQTVKGQNLAEILHFESLLDSGLALNLAITTQLHALRLMASFKKPSLITASLPALTQDNPRSPTQLLLRAAKESSMPTAKAAKQLDTLSQALLSLCPSVSSSEDEVAISAKLNSPPKVALRLQILAFQARLLWWGLAGHQGNVEKEILDPFSRCLSAFARRSHGEANENYQSALGVVQAIQDAVHAYDKHCWKVMGSSAAGIYRTLGSLAQDARAYEEAIGWIEKVQCGRNTSASDTQRCSIAASLVAMRLITAPNDSKVNELFIEVIKGMNGPLKGASQDLDELLTEVSQARRASISLLAKRRTGSTSGTNDIVQDGVRQMCESLVLQCPRFTMRYLGSKPESNAAAQSIIRHEQRRQFIARSAFNTVDSALYLIKIFQSDCRLTWDLMESTLQDCLALLEAVGDGAENEVYRGISYFVKISNLYYAQYLNMRRDAEGPKDIQHLRPLRRSIDCVRNRPISEKEESVLLSKLERIADMYRSMGLLDEAKDSLTLLRDELIGRGALSKVVTAARTEPMLIAWDHDVDTSMLGRANTSILKLAIKLKPNVAGVLPCDPNWSVEEKGAVMELCLNFLSKSSKDVLLLQRSLLKELLALYQPKEFPIRRLRVSLHLLRLDPSQRQEFTDDIKSTLTLANLESIIMESRDCALRPYLLHLQALASTILELQENHPRVNLLKPHLATWCSILEACKDHEGLASQIDDISDLLNHLHSMADFLHMKGLCSIRVPVLRMVASINELPGPGFNPDDLIISYSTLALQYLELGYSGKAGIALDRAQSLASQHNISPEVLLRVSISYAEYLITLGNRDKCEETLLRAQANASRMLNKVDSTRNHSASSERIGMNRLVADAHLVYSMLALERGATRAALSHAKQSLRLNCFAWSNTTMQRRSRENTPEQSQVESLTEDVTNLSAFTIVPHVTSTSSQPLGPSLWASVNPLFRSLCNLSKLYAHHGMFRETMYYAVQAYQLVTMTNSVPYIISALIAKGSAWLSAGSLDQASELLTEAEELSVSSGEKHVSILLSCNLGTLHGLLGSPDMEMKNYDNAYATLKALSDSTFISNFDRIVDPAVLLEEEMSRLVIKPKKSLASRRLTKKPQATKTATIAKVQAEMMPSIGDECLQLASLRGYLLRRKASSLVMSKEFDEALALLEEADSFSRSQLDAVDQHIGMAKQLLLQAVYRMTSDPLYSTLQDSTISLPAIMTATRRCISGSDRISGTRISPPRKPTSRDHTRTKSPSLVPFHDLLLEANDHLTEAHLSATQISTTANHSLSSLLNTSTILLSATGPSKGKVLAHPNFAACSLEIARNIAVERERKAVLGDIQAFLRKESEFSWPMVPISDPPRSSTGFMAEAIRFQKEYIDIIPATWTVISISLSDSQNELCLTKLQAGSSPFVLRLPLGRNNSRDIDEQVFDFKQGKTELHDIVSAANYTSHSARNLKGREAKVEWWEQREALDMRLKDLLENMENVWLGGFKGVFSQQKRRPEQLARFQTSFHLILDKHLPSRQNMGRKSKMPRITFDPRIWELFVGLGDVAMEGCDFDEPLTDLLYFVVDVLQLHGERNALDEIDFDSFVIETLDALRCYHEAVLSSGARPDKDGHTILILDKALHAFPWESLPCMDGLAVSRLPSLSCLRERILKRQQVAEDGNDTEGHRVDRASGAYVLNPGGDLKSTQVAFESTLQGLTGWNAIVKREPTEAEFKENLELKDILLYFGHGSGAQYIRSKAIKRLDKCAVAVLMGCSSGALNEAGEFEPYGPPMDYMLAGCPSLVATLWDVTDQDIDRFAKSTFEHWGLFNSEAVRNDAPRGKGKKRAEQAPVTKKKVSLVEAVAKGRKACNLRYLTAAAVCVYGIPVYFK